MHFTSFNIKRSIIEFLISVLLIFITIFQISAQDDKDSSIQILDSSRITKFNPDSVKKYFKASDTLLSFQLKTIEDYNLILNQINSKLRRGIDTTEISKGLPLIDTILAIVNINLTGFRGQTSLKILSTSKTLLEQIKKKLTFWQDELTNHNNDLNSIKEQVNRIANDSELLIMPEDSLLFLEYIKKLKPLGEKTIFADSIVAIQLRELGIIQNKVSTNYLELSELLDEINIQMNNFDDRIWQKEFGYIWGSEQDTSYKSKFSDVLDKSFKESRILLKYYIQTNWDSRFLVLIIGVLFFWLMRKNILKIRNQSQNSDNVLSQTNHISNHLFSSTVVLCLMLIPFIFTTAPQAYSLCLWSIQIIALSILLRDKINLVSGLQLLSLLIVFFVTGFTNLLIETTYTERWIQLFISSVSILLGLWIILSSRDKHFSKTKLYKPLILLFILLNAAAFLFNVFGRVTIAKIFNTTAIYGIIEAINLLIFVEIIIDAVFISMEANKKSSRLTAFFEHKGIEHRLRKILGIFVGIVWLILFTHNLHLYDTIFGTISEFLSTEHEIGDLTFSFGSIVIFVLVIWISTLISQMVSYIFGEQEKTASGDNINKLGSTLLLIRLGILSAGVLLAFGASGIPLDKLAIIIGALGVGIGFGLQTIVNNLVSGIVIAFEKPIQIGDVIEVGNRSGKVKDIGLRSSTLSTFDGSEVIVPNGDILSQHLINWTKDNEIRRIIIPLGVAYGTDIKNVKELIIQIINSDEEILKYPSPIVRVVNFGDNSVDLNIYFWSHVSDWIDQKSDLMASVYNKLNEEGIEIPFPQRDLHVRSIDEEIFKKVNKKEDK